MWWVQLLDVILWGAVLVVPWVLFLLLLVPFWSFVRREWIVMLVLAGFVTGFFVHAVNPRTETLTQATANEILEPSIAAYQQSIRRGQAPLWMDQYGVGLPALANPYLAYFSPLTALTLFVRDGATGLSVLVMAHIVLAAVGVYLLARSVGVSVPGAALAVIPFVFNPWLFRRLGFEIHVTYAIGYAWLPWFWASVIRFLKTRAWRDAALGGIPLAFLMVNVPTIPAFALLGASILGAVQLAREVVRRAWRPAGRLLFGGLFALLVGFLVVAPEHLAAVELARTQPVHTRLTGRVGEGRWNPIGGWRIRDLSVPEFVRSTLSGPVGQRLLPEQGTPAYFGVPYAPREHFVLLALLGVTAALVRPAWRRSTLAVSHLILFFILASIFVRGIFFNLAWCCFPLFDRAGIFPVVGAILLLPVAIFAGVGIDAILFAITSFARRVSGGLRPWSLRTRLLRPWTRRIAFAGTGLLSVVALGTPAVWEVWFLRAPEENPEHKLFEPRFTVPRAGKVERTRMTHFRILQERFADHREPARIFCLNDAAVWPGPCLDFLAPMYHLAVVGVSEVGWFVPSIQAQPINAGVQEWEASGMGPFLASLFRLAGVEAVVATKAIPSLPLIAEFPWTDFPGSFELYGYFSGLLQKARNLTWRPDYVSRVFVHAVPETLPRVMFADAFSPDPPLDALPDMVAHLHRLQGSAPLTSASPAAGEWRVTGTVPTDGALVFSQLFYPGFRAVVNGRAVPPQRAYLFFTAVPVRSGEVSVRLRYAPLPIYYAGLVSLAVAGGLAAWVWRGAHPRADRRSP